MFEDQEPALYPESIDMYQIVRQVLQANQLRAERMNAVITLDPEQEQVFALEGDRVHLTSVVFNLLDNALKYVRGQPRIHISLERTGKKIALQITDNGIGIAPEFQQRVFEKFFRIPAEKSIRASGHGLGLSYVAHVIQQHGGNIRLESEPGKGSTFTVELPGERSEK
jgi:signal transduction histidine kinase